MSKLRKVLLTSTETSPSLPTLRERKIHNNVASIIQNAKPKVILHLGSLPHAIDCGRLIEKDSEILYAKHLSPTIEDWISPERSKLRKNGIPDLFDAYMQYINQENLQDVITVLNSDLSVIAELLMIKEVVPDMIMMDEGFSKIDPTIFTSPLTSLPLIIQDFSFSHVKTKGNNNLLLNNPYYENILLQKNFVIASKNFERIIEVTGKTVIVRSEKPEPKTEEIKPAETQEKKEPKAEIKETIKPEKKIEERQEKPKKIAQEEKSHAEKTEGPQNNIRERNEKRKKILEEKARVRAERRRRRPALNNKREEVAEKPEALVDPAAIKHSSEHAAKAVQQESQHNEQVMAIHAEIHQPEPHIETPHAAPVPPQAQYPAQPQVQQPAQPQVQPQAQQPVQPQAQQPVQPQAQQPTQQPAQQPPAPVQRQASPAVPQAQAAQQEQLQQHASQAVQQAAPMPTEGQQEEVVNSAKRALLQKRLRARLGK